MFNGCKAVVVVKLDRVRWEGGRATCKGVMCRV